MAYFTTGTFKFLRDLDKNNNREWFKTNQDRYEEYVREPALDFITDFTGILNDLSPHIQAVPKKVGGSLFRIQRDTRFAASRGEEPIPYKTNTGVHFRHERAKDAHAPGFYLHVAPGECFMGAGLWRPETRVAYQIRAHIDAEQAQWRKVTGAKAFTKTFTHQGDSLSRPPKGYDADHPLLDDLKRKDFIVSTKLTQKQVTGDDFLEFFGGLCRTSSPYMAFLCRALDLSY